MSKRWLGLILLLMLLSACLTYYKRQKKFNNNFEEGNLKAARSIMKEDKKGPKRKSRLLYFLNLGLVDFLLGNYQQSNQYFEKAYLTVEDYRKTQLEKAGSFFSNPRITTYTGEHHEELLINYYKALNYLFQRDFEAALVECRRMNIRLNKLRDLYSNRKIAYNRDAFVHMLMGLIYEADRDYNNAFIAYRNAYEAYRDLYQYLFLTPVPRQLKPDILRTAYLSGLDHELSRYEKEFDTTYQPEFDSATGTLVFFWHNGLGPVKDEFSIDFAINRTGKDTISFKNDRYGLYFPYPRDDEESGLEDLEVIRIALPKYVERPPLFTHAKIHHKNKIQKLEMVENVTRIAFQSLTDRILKELSHSLLRLAVKKAVEHTVKKENEEIGSAIGIINAITEHADTRNWQTLPHNIHFARMQLPAGKNRIILNRMTPNREITATDTFQLFIEKREIMFKVFRTLNTKGEKFYREQFQDNDSSLYYYQKDSTSYYR